MGVAEEGDRAAAAGQGIGEDPVERADQPLEKDLAVLR